MAIRTYNITTEDVLPHLPVDSATVGDLTEPIAAVEIERYIKGAAVEITAALLANGFDPDNLGDETEQMIQAGVVHGAVARALAHMGHAGAQYEIHQREWERVRDNVSKYAPALVDYAPRTRNNIDQTTTKPAATFKGTGYRF